MAREQHEQKIEKLREIIENTTEKPSSDPPPFTSSSGKQVKQKRETRQHNEK